MNKLFNQLLELRHLSDTFLHPQYQDLIDPFLLPDMEPAVERIKAAINTKENILIYGDYDVDGVTASTVMEHALRLAGANQIMVMLPDRFIDGYGMSQRLVEQAQSTHTTLVITVDCGSRNHEIVARLSSLGIDTIITDHHECEEKLPSAIAVINPKRQDFAGPSTLRNLAGVGVAFKVAEALVNKKLIPAGQEKWLLDLVLLGTICDNMTLSQENRILSFYGAKVLDRTRRPGLQELMRSAGVKTITSESIGFQIGPRLNAAGRLETAELSLNLLRTSSRAEAAQLAATLESLNKKRRDEQRAATDEIAKRHQEHPCSDPVIIETGDWHEGILGIVAGRLVDKYHKPALVLSKVDDDKYKGSGRSFGDFNLAAALNYAKETIIGGGGHAAAAGVQVSTEKLASFRDKINEYYCSLHLQNQEKYLHTSADLTIDSLADFNLELIENLCLLEPFGPGNEEPVFCISSASIASLKRMGDRGQHLRLDIIDKNGKPLKCIAFFAPESWLNLPLESTYNFLVKPTLNEFRGVRSVEGQLIDIIECY